jgi:hypothetical protein
MLRRFDDVLRRVLQQPARAVVAFVVGSAVGLTMAAAFVGGDEGGQYSGEVVLGPSSVGSPSGERSAAPDPPQRRRKRARRPSPSGDLGLAVERAAAAVGATRVGVAAVRLDGSEEVSAGDPGEFVGWSTLKIPAIAAYLTQNPAPTAAAQSQIERAISASSNLDVRRLYQELISTLGIAGANALLVEVVGSTGGTLTGVPNTIDRSIDSVAFGEARWTVQDGTRFFQQFAEGCVLSGNDAETRNVLTAMNNLSEGTWGAPTVFPSDRVFSKSGWGQGSDGWTVSQFAIVGRGPKALVVGIALQPSSYEEGQAAISRAMTEIEAVAGTPAGGGDSLPPGCGLLG